MFFIYNKSINTGLAPNVLKISRITPIYKSGVKMEANNYRSISTLSPFAKVLDKIAMIIYMTASSDSERVTQLNKRYNIKTYKIDIIYNLKTAIDNREITCEVFLNFSKAFDTVNHHILLAKLYKYSIRRTPLSWFKDYLKNRQQHS